LQQRGGGAKGGGLWCFGFPPLVVLGGAPSRLRRVSCSKGGGGPLRGASREKAGALHFVIVGFGAWAAATLEPVLRGGQPGIVIIAVGVEGRCGLGELPKAPHNSFPVPATVWAGGFSPQNILCKVYGWGKQRGGVRALGGPTRPPQKTVFFFLSSRAQERGVYFISPVFSVFGRGRL